MGGGMMAAMLMTMFPMALAVLSFLPYAYTERVHASDVIVNALYKSGLTPGRIHCVGVCLFYVVYKRCF